MKYCRSFFTEKEAKVGAKFPFGAITIEELQKVMGMNKDELEQILNGMIKKGLVIATKKRWSDPLSPFNGYDWIF